MIHTRARKHTAFVLAAVASLSLVTIAAASDAGHAAADQVTQNTYRYFLGDMWGYQGILYTHNGDSRGPGAPQHDLAMQNIVDEFESYGLTVTLEPVNYQGTTYYNVVGTQWGTLFPDQEYIIGAHYDSVSNPGADDNASGTSLVLECARILTQYDSDYTIRYIAFTREEQGLYGSEAYVDQHAGDDILGMISADMVAYDTGSNYARIYSHSYNSEIRDALGASILEYGMDLTWSDAGWISASDHAPFDAAGYQACLLIEGEVWDNPYYHTQQDSVDNPNNINYVFAEKMVRSVCGYLVDEAGVLVDYDGLDFTYPDERPEFSSPAGGTTVRVEVAGVGTASPQPGTGVLHYNTGGGWQSTPLTIVAENVYDAVLPPATCGGTLEYYLSAEDTTGTPYTDPRNAPTTTFDATVAYGELVLYENMFDTNPGWSTTGDWEFGQPTGQGGAYGGPDPTSGYTGNNVYGYNLNGDYTNNMPERHLTTTAIDCTGAYGVQLSFWRWLGVEQPSYDHAYVRISNNGSTWTTLWENSATISDSAWVQMSFDISAYADNQPTVYLRWTMGITDVGWTYCGWNVDDVRLFALDCQGPALGACCAPDGTCTLTEEADCLDNWLGEDTVCDPNPCPQPWCLGDLNCSYGAPTFEDILYFVAAMGGQAQWEQYHLDHNGAPPTCSWLLGDFSNPHNGVDFADIEPFANSVGQPCIVFEP